MIMNTMEDIREEVMAGTRDDILELHVINIDDAKRDKRHEEACGS